MSIEDNLQSVSFVNDTEKEFSSEAEETDVVVEFSNSPVGSSYLLSVLDLPPLFVLCSECNFKCAYDLARNLL